MKNQKTFHVIIYDKIRMAQDDHEDVAPIS